MAGLPSSGKTYALGLLSGKKGIEIIDPAVGMPENIRELPDDEQRDIRITAWECSLLDARICINDPKISIVILDSCASKFEPIRPLIVDAKAKHRKIVFCYVKRSFKDCESESGLDQKVMRQYEDNFKRYIPQFASVADIKIVLNNDGITDIKRVLKEKVIEILRSNRGAI